MTVRSDDWTQFLGDILTAAIEGGTGYWAQVSQYQWRDDDGSIHCCVGERVPDAGARATIHELKEDESGYREEGLTIDARVITRGIRLIITDEVGVRSDLKRWIDEGFRECDAGMIDADCADVIVQAGLFDEVRYG